MAGINQPQPNIETAVIDTLVSADILPGRAGYKMWVYGLLLYNLAAQDVTIREGPDKNLLAIPSMPATTPIQLTLGFDEPLWKLELGQPLRLVLGTPTRVTGVAKLCYRRQ